MLRLFATPKTTPTFPSKTGWVIQGRQYARLPTRKSGEGLPRNRKSRCSSPYEHSTRFRRWLPSLFNFVRAGGIPARIVADKRGLIAGGLTREHSTTAV